MTQGTYFLEAEIEALKLAAESAVMYDNGVLSAATFGGFEYVMLDGVTAGGLPKAKIVGCSAANREGRPKLPSFTGAVAVGVGRAKGSMFMCIGRDAEGIGRTWARLVTHYLLDMREVVVGGAA